MLVNGTSGEGMLQTVQERKQVAEAWSAACRKHGLVLMVQIGGAPYPDVVELARHAEGLAVDGVLCLPELYFKPKSPEKLTEYLRNVAAHCPETPFFYYHISMFTDVNGEDLVKIVLISVNILKFYSSHANLPEHGGESNPELSWYKIHQW